METTAISLVAQKMRAARWVTVLSGAGLSAESGIPTFRDPNGVWKNHNPFDLATVDAFQRDPALVWEFYNERRAMVMTRRPNAAHVALARLGQLVPQFTHIAQNVDGLAQQAGDRNIIELHGNLFSTRCSVCNSEHPHLNEIVEFPATCQRCGNLLRPGVVWFGEPVEKIGEAAEAAMHCDTFLLVGTSAVVQPAASLTLVAKQQHAFVAEFNIKETSASDLVDVVILGPVGRTLPAVIQEMEK